jgi:hypothetical protein
VLSRCSALQLVFNCGQPDGAISKDDNAIMLPCYNGKIRSGRSGLANIWSHARGRSIISNLTSHQTERLLVNRIKLTVTSKSTSLALFPLLNEIQEDKMWRLVLMLCKSVRGGGEELLQASKGSNGSRGAFRLIQGASSSAYKTLFLKPKENL